MNKSPEHYSEFTEEDFIADPFFQEWVLRPDTENNTYWERFLLDYPGKRKEAAAARGFLMTFKEKDAPVTDDYIQEKIDDLMEGLKDRQQAKRILLWQPGFQMALRAAVISGIIILSGLFFYRLIHKNPQPEQLSIATGNGKMEMLVLPDSSSIVLNANSQITYNKAWDKTNAREIWMKGEAFFSVKHLNTNKNTISPGERFVVHTEQLVVNVLGTSFDIRERRGKTEVVLQTGSIKITFPDNAHPDMLLVPGDYLTYLHDTKKIIKTTIQPEHYTAWKEKVLLLKNPTLEEIIYYLGDTYGKDFIIEDKKLRSRVIEGPIRMNNLDNVLFIISTVLNVDVIQKDNTVIIRSK